MNWGGVWFRVIRRDIEPDFRGVGAAGVLPCDRVIPRLCCATWWLRALRVGTSALIGVLGGESVGRAARDR